MSAYPTGPVPAVHPRHAHSVPTAACHSVTRDASDPRVSRLRRPSPPRRAYPQASGGNQGLSPARSPCWGGASGRLGLIRHRSDRTRDTLALRLRNGAVLLAGALRALHTGPVARKLPSRPCRGPERLRRYGQDPGLRQPQERGARAQRHCDPLSSPPAGARRALSLRTPGVYAGTRK